MEMFPPHILGTWVVLFLASVCSSKPGHIKFTAWMQLRV